MNKTSSIVSRLIIMNIVIFILGCQGSDNAKLPNSIKWVRTSVEYEAICIQTYRSAWEAVKAADQQSDEQWAIVLDVDETVLDNSLYEATTAEKGLSYPTGWADWVLSAKADAVPGAKAFIDSVHTLGANIHVVYITNRDTAFKQATIKNLKSLNMWRDDDLMLCQRDKSDTKAIRRNEVVVGTGRCEGKGKRTIIALIGDQLGDVADYEKSTKSDSLQNHFKNAKIWGNKSFVLPNPMYGSWMNGYQ